MNRNRTLNGVGPWSRTGSRGHFDEVLGVLLLELDRTLPATHCAAGRLHALFQKGLRPRGMLEGSTGSREAMQASGEVRDAVEA